MDSLLFAFLLFASYCLALIFVLTPRKWGWPTGMTIRSGINSWSVVELTVAVFIFSDDAIDPIVIIVIQGERWFLGNIYGYH